MDELANPYRPGAGTTPPALVGRDRLLAHMRMVAQRTRGGRPGKAIVCVGLRGTGKTVLLNRFVDVGREEGFAVGAIEAPEPGDLPGLLYARLRRILLALDEERPSAKVLRALRILKTFTFQLPHDAGAIQLDVEALAGEADSGVLADDVTDLLVAAGEAAAERERGVLLAIDELQNVSAAELAALIAAVHRTAQLDLPVLLVGAGLPSLPALVGGAKSYAERLFEFPRIGSLPPEEARAALEWPAVANRASWSRAALDRVVEASQGYPYFLQEWGYHVWNGAPGPRIRVADVERAAPHVVERLDRDFFHVRLDRLTRAERAYLHAMARLGPGPHRSDAIADELGAQATSLAPRRALLIGKGMVWSPEPGATAFTVPLFDEFLRRLAPSTAG